MVGPVHELRLKLSRCKNTWPRRHFPNEASQAPSNKLSSVSRQRPGVTTSWSQGGDPKGRGPSVNCHSWLFIDHFIAEFGIEISSWSQGGDPKGRGPSVNCHSWLFIDHFIAEFGIEISSENIGWIVYDLIEKVFFLIVC